MNRLLCVSSLFCALLAPTIARGDQFSTFALSGSHSSKYQGGTVGGTITVDTTAGLITSFDLTFSGEAASYVSVGSSQSAFDGNYFFSEAFSLDPNHNNGFTEISILLPVSTLVGYTGGQMCTTQNLCAGGLSIFTHGPAGGDYFHDGQLSPVPEPSSVVLLGTGSLALLAAARRRFIHV